MEHAERLWRYAQEFDNWLGVSICVSIILALYALHMRLNDPRRMERIVARRLEDQKIADLIEVTLDRQVRQSLLSQKAQARALRKLSKVYPDLGPSKKSKVVGVPFKDSKGETTKWYAYPIGFNLQAARMASIKRLRAMGVDIAKKLPNFGRSRTTKKDRITAALKSST